MRFVIDDIRIELRQAEVIRRLRLERMPDPEGTARDLIRRVLALAEPRAVYGAVAVDARGEGWIQAGGVRLESAVLARHTRGAQQVFPHVVTLGPGVEEEASASTDLLVQFGLHEVGNLALARAEEAARERVGRASGAGRLYSLQPGALADWPLTEQGSLFRLLGDVEAAVGVRLTESFLMVPRKSVSGIWFPSDEAFVSCRLCDRDRCPARRARYDPGAGGGDGGGPAPRP